MKEEEWRPIKDYEGVYSVSSRGRVKSHGRIVENRWHKERILSGDTIWSGYKRVHIRKNLKPKKFFIHRLVAFAFIPNPKNKPFVNHINGIKNDNNVGNLEWCTSSENEKHSYDILKKQGLKGEINGRSILTNKDIIEIRKSNKSPTELSKIYKVTPCAISLIIRRKRWSHI